MGIGDKQQYKAPYLYLINMWLKEYDIEKANISILYEEGILSDQEYQKFYHMEKREREVSIGCLLRDNRNLISILQNGMKKARNTFLLENHIEDSDVLYIDNDSITVIQPKMNTNKEYITQFNRINFRLKKVYSSFYRLKDIDFLYFNDGVKEDYRIKYANSKDMIEKHKNGFLEFLLTICNEAEMGHVLNPLQMIKFTYCKYVRHELSADFYREFNIKSMFRLKPGLSFVYYTDIPSGYNMNYVDISYNAYLFMELYKYFANEYFKGGYR